MRKNEVVIKLEKEAERLSKENNPHNLGNDVLIFAIAQLINSLDTSDRINKKLTYAMIGLTIFIAVLTVKMAFP